MSFDWMNFTVAAPLLALAAGALAILVLDLLLEAREGQDAWYIAAIGAVLLAGYYLVPLWGKALTGFAGALVMDQLALVYSGILLAVTLLTVVLAFGRGEKDRAGYLSLLLWAAIGMIVMASAGNLITLFLGLELLSLSLYVAVAFDPTQPRAREAALKYFVLGSVASGFILFGFALIYGVTGSTMFSEIARAVADSLYLKVGIALALVGFGFKLALAPFHAWAPDVYQGAPTPTTAFMSVGTKGAAFVMLARFLMAVVPAGRLAEYLFPLAVLAVLSMLVGSTVGIWQSNLKRLLAYSSVAHAGYLVMAIPGLGADGMNAAAYYLAAYGFTAMGLFALITLLETEGKEGAELESFAGLYYERPVLAAVMAVMMFALTGLPPTGGFVGKFLLAKAAVGALKTDPTSAWTLLLGLILSTGISAYVYLRVIGILFKKPAGERPGQQMAAAGAGHGEVLLSAPVIRGGILAVLAIATIGVLLMGILPGGFMGLLTVIEGH